MPILVLEGVAGTGKTAVLRVLQVTRPAALVYPEAETFGAYWDQLQGPPDGSSAVAVLKRVLDRVEQAPRDVLQVVERFHPSYFALLPPWELYASVDARLAALGARMVILDYDPARLAERSLHRPEKAPDWADGYIQMSGGEAVAVGALAKTRHQRLGTLRLTALPATVIRTDSQDWPAITRQVLSFALSS